MVMRASRRWLALLGLAACAPDFTPRSVLQDVRVLALVADPPELGPGESVTVAPKLFAPGDPPEDVSCAWTFCPFSLGSSVGYACAAPACEVSLSPAADGSVTADPTALALQCLQTLQQGGSLPPPIPPQLPPVVDVVFRCRATDPSGGVLREAVQLVPVDTVLPPPSCASTWPACRNHNPVIQQVEIGGQAVAPGGTCPAVPPCPRLAPGGELEVVAHLDPASAETYLDPAGRPVQEQLVVSFFTTAGRFDFDRGLGPDARVKLKYEDIAGSSTAEVWVVARDLRGGEAAVGPFLVEVGP
jgi:hypothetical protein